MPARPIEEKFWEKVDKRGPEDCWPWKANTVARGYGTITIETKERRFSLMATHISWSLFHGKEFPKGMSACHSCDNPRCVNPLHIWPGTQKQNLQDAVKKKRMWKPVATHCKRGHKFTKENTYISKSSFGRGRKRACRKCKKISKMRTQ